MSFLRPVWNANHGLPIDLPNINWFILHRFFATLSPVTETRRKPRATCMFLYLYIYINIHVLHKYIYMFYRPS
jgi:hypothetical protein